MRCSHFRRLVVLCDEAEMSLEQRCCCNLHQAECLACREFRREMRGMEYLLSLVTCPRAPAEFSGKVMERIRQTPARPRGIGLHLAWRR